MINSDYHLLKVLRISAPQLKNLVIHNNDPMLVGYCKIELCTPNLLSLELQGYLYKDYYVENLPSLVSANIRFVDNMNARERSRVQNLIKVLKSLYNVTTLQLYNWNIQNLPKCQDIKDELPNSFYNLRSLKFVSGRNYSCIHVIEELLKRSPIIETLVLQISQAFCYPGTGQERGEESSFQCLFPHLRFVEVQNLRGLKSEHKFLKSLLENAVVLEKLTIGPSTTLSRYQEMESANIRNHLQSLPKASSSVRILFLD
ncbi:hypothetical protein AQUCO_00900196v1 [Aquilegia coerulea]|uniref:FBD domain-containing protein n=2 Tax=Aquilegia coerulea TaxID=218851 RepID=A0A2G5ECF2_AQUCA|nr:hypothetical protein AQUCO_00900196v1 [Aquilegia coerulea]